MKTVPGHLRQRLDELGIDMKPEYAIGIYEQGAVHLYVRGGKPDLTFVETTPFEMAYDTAKAGISHVK